MNLSNYTCFNHQIILTCVKSMSDMEDKITGRFYIINQKLSHSFFFAITTCPYNEYSLQYQSSILS